VSELCLAWATCGRRGIRTSSFDAAFCGWASGFRVPIVSRRADLDADWRPNALSKFTASGGVGTVRRMTYVQGESLKAYAAPFECRVFKRTVAANGGAAGGAPVTSSLSR
jgi:hypothetical protein